MNPSNSQKLSGVGVYLANKKQTKCSWGETLTMKSYSRNGDNTSEFANDHAFYMKYPKIRFEDDNYLILSDSQHSSDNQEDFDEDEDWYNENRIRQ